LGFSSPKQSYLEVGAEALASLVRILALQNGGLECWASSEFREIMPPYGGTVLSVFSNQVQTLNKKPIAHYYRHWRSRTFLPHRAKSRPTDGRKKRRRKKRKRRTITNDTETGDVKLVN
jgi:hypothetical protein